MREFRNEAPKRLTTNKKFIPKSIPNPFPNPEWAAKPGA